MKELHRSRFGYHPCSYNTYRKLKELNKVFEKAMHLEGIWERWYRKQPQNRVLRKKIRNSLGQVIGYQTPIPILEPKLCSIFGSHLYDSIPADYKKSRTPAIRPEDIQALSMSYEEIERLYDKLYNRFLNNT